MRNELVALSCSALLLAACSSDDTDSSPTDSASTTISEPAVLPPELDADGRVLFAETVTAFVINTVVAYEADGLDPEGAIADALRQVYPSLRFVGYAIEADSSSISVISTALDDQNVAGPDNPLIFAVATRQVSGECFGEAVYGYPLPTQRYDIVEPSECTAQSVFDTLATVLP